MSIFGSIFGHLSGYNMPDDSSRGSSEPEDPEARWSGYGTPEPPPALCMPARSALTGTQARPFPMPEIRQPTEREYWHNWLRCMRAASRTHNPMIEVGQAENIPQTTEAEIEELINQWELALSGVKKGGE